MSADSKNTWKKESGYIWSMLGSAVGFANILSFSAQCYKNGGGAFLIPYFIAMLVLGIPMLFLEGVIGQKMSSPVVTAYGKTAGSAGKFFGWLSVIACLTIGGFYVVLTGYSVAYTYFAAAGQIPTDSLTFFKDTFLQDSGSLTEIGGIAFTVLIATAVVSAFTWFVLVRNVQSGIERICSLFLPLLGVCVILFATFVAFLPGAFNGVGHYLKPDFARLGDMQLWRDVFGQLFFSFSLGLGIVTGYSRHTSQTTSIPRAMVLVATGDFLISFIAGFAVFGCIGYMSHVSGTPFESIVKTDSAFEIGFVIFPKILQLFGPVLSQMIGALFFFCVFIAGITGVFSIVESVAGNIEVEFKKTRKFAVTVAVIFTLAVALPFCLGNGQYILDALVPMVIGNNMLIGGIAEIIVFMFIAKIIKNDAIWFRGKKRIFAYYSLRTFVITILPLILGASIVAEMKVGFGLPEMVRWGWLVIAAAVAVFLARKKPAEQKAPGFQAQSVL